jgi:hypothetical protein
MRNRQNSQMKSLSIAIPAIISFAMSASFCDAANPPGAGRLNIEFESFWLSKKIALVRIVAVDDLDPDHPRYSVAVEKAFTPDPFDNTMVVPASFLTFEGTRPPLKKGDHLVFALPREGHRPVLAVKYGTEEERRAMVESLDAIAAIRTAPDKLASLRRSLRSDRSPVVLYSLGELSKLNLRLEDDEDLVASLSEARGKEALHPIARLRANALLESAHPNRRNVEQTIAWLKSAIANSKTASGYDLSPLVTEFVNATSNREAAVEFLLALATDSNLRSEIRTVAIGALAQEKCFDRTRPFGKTSEKIFNSLSSLLRDNNPLIRQSAVQALHDVAVWTEDPGAKPTMVTRVIAELQKAESVEKDARLRGLIRSYLLYLKE